MHTIRSFIAIPLGTEVQRSARRLLRDLRQDKDGIKWVPEDNLHLTLKFLGDVVDREVPNVCAAIRRAAEDFEPFEIEFSGTGGFPSLQRPRVIWAGISSGGQTLIELVGALERELATLGFKPEPRDYRPHLTLGRVKSGSRSAAFDVTQRVSRQEHRSLGTMMAEQIRLYASYLDKSGPTYHVMDTIGLGQESDFESDDDND